MEQLFDLFHLTRKSVVLELNRQIVSRNTYANTKLKEGDTLEIVHFVGGG